MHQKLHLIKCLGVLHKQKGWRSLSRYVLFTVKRRTTEEQLKGEGAKKSGFCDSGGDGCDGGGGAAGDSTGDNGEAGGDNDDFGKNCVYK